MGPAGTGKSILALQYAHAEAVAGRRARAYLFDERVATALQRAQGLGIAAGAQSHDGRLTLKQIEPTEMSPGEFAMQDIVHAVEVDGVSLIVIDSVNGYMQAMPAERLLLVQVHELLSYLSTRGVTMIMTLWSNMGVLAALRRRSGGYQLSRRHRGVDALLRATPAAAPSRHLDREETDRRARTDHSRIQCWARAASRWASRCASFRGVLTGTPEKYIGAARNR